MARIHNFSLTPRVPRFAWSLFSERQLEAFTWWTDISPERTRAGVIMQGPVRTGKTFIGFGSFLKWGLSTFHHETFGICGKSIGIAYRNVVKPLLKARKSLGISIRLKKDESIVIIRDVNTGNDMTCYLFGGNDERSQDRIQGITLAGVFLDEVTLMPESFVNQAVARCSVPGSKIWFALNPQSPTHWFKREFVDKCEEKNLLVLSFQLDDNYSLTQEIKDRLRAMYTGVFYKRYILGLWCLADGLVYDEFNRRKADMVVATPTDKELLADYGEYIVSCDYGIQNPHVYLMEAWNTKLLRWEVVREYYWDGRGSGVQKTDNEYYDDLVTFVGDIPVQYVIIDPSAASFVTLVKQRRQFRPVGASNPVVPGITYTSGMFHLGKLVICDCCTNTIRELGIYSWDEKKSTTTGLDTVLKVDDHTADCLRYFTYTHVRRYARRYGIYALLGTERDTGNQEVA